MDSTAQIVLTLPYALARHVASKPDALACRAGERRRSFAEVDRHSSQIAPALAAIGVRTGHRVACLARHPLDCLLLTLAACKLGAVCMPVNWRLAASEVAAILAHGEARFALADAAFLALPPAVGAAMGVCTEQAQGDRAGFAARHAGQPGTASRTACRCRRC
jgi:acyl-CoA synthetase (AMP-forming)/AMP-acid ligase II